jgi:DNA-binding transcriptional regulator YhcF (GntR family)
VSSASAPPYARIVADLKGRIEAGDLAPGDRVPSTREITRDWGVAMATATKALTALRQEGLVRAVPGVGTVVDAGARPAVPASGGVARTASRRRPVSDPLLSTEAIVAAAIVVADTEGLTALSMRRVAAEIGVATMSLYRHVADKDDLLTRMMDAAFAEWQMPEDAPPGWRGRLDIAARGLWLAFRGHPWLAPSMSMTRPQPFPRGLAYTEWVLSALDGYGLDAHTIFTTHLTLINYVRGTAVNLEPEFEAEATSGMDNEEWMDTQESALHEILGSGRFPMFERLVRDGYDFDLDALFEFGLQRLLDGFTGLIEGP